LIKTLFSPDFPPEKMYTPKAALPLTRVGCDQQSNRFGAAALLPKGMFGAALRREATRRAAKKLLSF
jgi:hypothetical protein